LRLAVDVVGPGGVFAVLWLLGSPVLKVKTIEAVQQDVPAA
jgi:hypothetical protein